MMKLNFINNPVMDSLLSSVGGLVAILREDLQILAANDVKKQFLGFDSIQEVLGLRIGAAIKCVYETKCEKGCGSGEICRTCDLYMGIVSCLKSGNADYRKCSLIIENAGQKKMLLKAHCSQLMIDSKRFLLLFLQDITSQQRLIEAEKKIFHNINNSVTGLVGTTQVMAVSSDDINEKMKGLLQICIRLSSRLVNETAMQRSIIQNEAFLNPSNYDFVTIAKIFDQMKEACSSALLSDNKSIIFNAHQDNHVIKTNLNFLMIVLNHMVKNALEETVTGGNIRVWTQLSEDQIIFNVWNNKTVQKDAAKKIFKRDFSTKPGMGRGHGTYSMKLFGEEILGGMVDFNTSDEGTVFRISLPILK